MPARKPHPPLRARGSRIVNQAATAALLLLVLAVGFLAISLRPPVPPDEAPWQPALAQALEDVPGVVDTSLIETTFTAAELPDGAREAVYYQLTIPPGASLPYLGGLFCGCRVETMTRGVGLEFVQGGAYSVRIQAPLRVQRAGASRPSEEMAAGTDVTFTAGDAIVYPDYTAPGDIRNTGNEPVTLIGVVINAMDASGTPIPRTPRGVQATMLSHASPSTWERVPPGLLHVALRQVMLPPGTDIGPYQPVGLQAIFVENGTILRNFLIAGETAASGQPLSERAGSTAPFVALDPGRRETLAVAGDEAADLLAIIIEPAVNNLQEARP